MLLSTFISLLAWVSIALSINLRLKVTPAAGLLFSACIIICSLFIGTVFNQLKLSYYIVVIFAFGQVLLPLLFGVRNIKIAANRVNQTPEALGKRLPDHFLLYLLAFLSLIVFTLKIYPDFMFFGWDEFSHWARYSKLLIDTSVAPVQNPAILFPTYPPAINLWHYFICGPGGYAEWKVLFAHILLSYCALLFVSSILNKLKGLPTLSIFIFGVFLYHAFGANFYEIFTDCLIGLLFAAALLYARHLSLDGITGSKSALFCSLLAVLSIIKPISFLFPITAIGLFFGLNLVQILFKKEQYKTSISNITFFNSSLHTVTFIFASLLTPFIWSKFLSSKSARNKIYDSREEVSFNAISEFLFTRETERTKIAWQELWDRIGFERISTYGNKQFRLDLGFHDPASPIYHGAIYLLIAVVILMLIRLIFNHKKAVLILSETFYLAATFTIYTTLIVFIIRHYFQLSDVKRLASLERYLSSFLMGMLLFAFTTLMKDISTSRCFRNRKQLLLIPVWLLLPISIIYIAPVSLDTVFGKPLNERPVPLVHPWANEYAEHETLRKHVKKLSDIVKSNANVDEKIYVIAQNETGFTFYMSGHELSPWVTNPNCFSIGPKYTERDVITCDYYNFEKTLKKYDYLMIRYADEQFWSNHGSYFEASAINSKSGVFRVIKEGDSLSFETIHIDNNSRGPDSPS